MLRQYVVYIILSNHHHHTQTPPQGHLKYIDLRGCEATFKSGEGANMIYIKGLKDEKRSNFKMRFEKESKMREWFRAVSIGIEIANRWPGESTAPSEASPAPPLSPSSSFRDAQICKRIMAESVNSGHMTKDEYDAMWFHEILSRVKTQTTEDTNQEDSEDSMDNNDEDDGEEEEDEKYQLCVRSVLEHKYHSIIYSLENNKHRYPSH